MVGQGRVRRRRPARWEEELWGRKGYSLVLAHQWAQVRARAAPPLVSGAAPRAMQPEYIRKDPPAGASAGPAPGPRVLAVQAAAEQTLAQQAVPPAQRAALPAPAAPRAMPHAVCIRSAKVQFSAAYAKASLRISTSTWRSSALCSCCSSFC